MATDERPSQDSQADGQPRVPDFTGIAGLSMNKSLFQLAGHEDIMARVLRLFAENYRDGLPALDGLLQVGGWQEARLQLHALRGSCGAAGAGDLTAQARRLEIRLLEAAALDAAAAAALRQEAGDLNQALIRLARAITERLAAAAGQGGGPA